jgi:hypothetical protein
MRTVQFVGVPEQGGAGECDAGVIALKTRSISAAEAVEQSLRALDRLLALGCRQIVFKICSTFDSTPEGNIGPVADALAERLGATGVPVCPAFPARGAPSTRASLRARPAPLGIRHGEASAQPDDRPDIRAGWRGSREIGRAPSAADGPRGAEAIRSALLGRSGRPRLVICDCRAGRDLVVLGEACADAPFSSAVPASRSACLPTSSNAGWSRVPVPPFPASMGRAACLRELLDGDACPDRRILQSASEHGCGHRARAISQRLPGRGRRLRGGESCGRTACLFLRFRRPDPRLPSGASGRSGSRTGWSIVRSRRGGADPERRPQAGRRRGETSGAVVGALGIRRLAIGPEIDPACLP